MRGKGTYWEFFDGRAVGLGSLDCQTGARQPDGAISLGDLDNSKAEEF